MAKSFISGRNNAAITPSTTNNFPVAPGSYFSGTSSANEFLYQLRVNDPGTFSNMSMNIPTNTATGSFTVRFRVAGANGNQVLTWSPAETGLKEDTTNTDYVAAGQLINLTGIFSATGGSITPAMTGVVFNRIGIGHNKILAYRCSSGNQLTLASSSVTRYIPIEGFSRVAGNMGSTSSQAVIKTRHKTTAKGLFLILSTNARAVSDAYSIDISGTSGNLLINTTASTIGEYEDSSNTDVISNGSDISYKVVSGATANTSILSTIGADFYSESAFMIVNSSLVGSNTAVATGTNYMAIGTAMAETATESSTQYKAPIPCLIKNLQINKSTGTTTLTLRKNTADTLLAVTSSGAGVTVNSSDIITISKDDLINYKIANSGSTTVYTICVDVVSLSGSAANFFFLF